MKSHQLALLSSLAVAMSLSSKFESFDKSQLSLGSFFEQFDSDDWSNVWKISQAKKDDEFSYVGEWSVEAPIIFPGLEGDKGLVLKTKAAHHAIHANLPEVFDNRDNTLVLQYEVKLQQGLSCGGAYLKLLSAQGGPNETTEFSNESTYQVMFGPDKCGTTNKVHLIIRRRDLNGNYEEKHLQVPPMARGVKTSTLYTLIIHPTQDFEIRIGGEVVKAGNLLEDGVFTPSFDPPKEIDDPEDAKPQDWDDQLEIPDPEQTTKPEDWDESAPYMIPDSNAEKPDSWDEEATEYIPDPTAEIPEDWDAEEDGEWVAPLIFNPECELHGCGQWKPPMVINPSFKGKWTQPIIANPNYKGEWSARKIANPNWYVDSTPSDLEPIGAIGFELWSMDTDIMFDNIYLGHSVDDAELLGNVTWRTKFDLEQDAVLAYKSEVSKDDNDRRIGATADEEFNVASLFDLSKNVGEAREYLRLFFEDPLNTISERPQEFGIYVLTSTILATLVLSLVTRFVGLFDQAAVKPKKSEDTTKEAEEKEQ